MEVLKVTGFLWGMRVTSNVPEQIDRDFLEKLSWDVKMIQSESCLSDDKF